MKNHIYRKLSLSMAMLLTAYLSFGGAIAETADTPIAENWYEITENIVIVELPADNAEGYEWDYEISNPDMLELLSLEYAETETPDDAALSGEENESVSESDTFENAFSEEDAPEYPGETYVASFKLAEGQTGDVTITLSYHGENEGESPLRVCTLQLSVDTDGEISVVSAEQVDGEIPESSIENMEEIEENSETAVAE